MRRMVERPRGSERSLGLGAGVTTKRSNDPQSLAVVIKQFIIFLWWRSLKPKNWLKYVATDAACHSHRLQSDLLAEPCVAQDAAKTAENWQASSLASTSTSGKPSAKRRAGVWRISDVRSGLFVRFRRRRRHAFGRAAILPSDGPDGPKTHDRFYHERLRRASGIAWLDLGRNQLFRACDHHNKSPAHRGSDEGKNAANQYLFRGIRQKAVRSVDSPTIGRQGSPP